MSIFIVQILLMNIRPLIRAAALTLFVTGSFNSQAQSSVDNDIPLSRYEMERYPYQPGAYSSKWPVIKEENIAWKKRVWRTITLNEAGNELLALSSLHPSLGDVLINGLYSNAFGPQGVYTTDRFNQQLDEAGIQRLKAGGLTASR